MTNDVFTRIDAVADVGRQAALVVQQAADQCTSGEEHARLAALQFELAVVLTALQALMLRLDRL